MEEKIGVKETAKILGLSKKSIYTKLRSGKLPGKKINTKYGQKWIINKKDLKEQAKVINEVVEIKEINKLINKEDILDEFVKVLNEQNKQDKEEIIEKLDKQQEIIKQQFKMIRQLQEEKNQSLLAKIKNLFT